MTNKKHYEVVAAVIEQAGRYLCVQHGATRYAYTSGKWEFPGGKVEAGETEPQALAREIGEELAMAVSVGRHLVTVRHDYPDFSIALSAYLCRPAGEGFTLREHIAARWLRADELETLDWAAADLGIVRAVVEGGR